MAPAPDGVASRFFDDPGYCSRNGAWTLGEASLGLFFGSAVAIALAVAMAHSRVLERAIFPLAIAAKVMPLVAIAPVLFGLANSLCLFCGARIIGGIFSAAMFPAATAYVADVTTDDERSRGMAWQGTAVSLGVVFGPAFVGLLARSERQLPMGFDQLTIPSFSVQFFAVALFALLHLPCVV